MKRSDIPDQHAIDLARRWNDPSTPGAVMALVAEGIPEKLALAKVLHVSERGLLDYGVPPYNARPVD